MKDKSKIPRHDTTKLKKEPIRFKLIRSKIRKLGDDLTAIYRIRN